MVSLAFIEFAEAKSVASPWRGKWMSQDATEFERSDMELKYLGSNRFEFTITTINGAHGGELRGVAREQYGRAVYTDPDSSSPEPCRLEFSVSRVPSQFSLYDRQIVVTQTASCLSFGGAGAGNFAGTYVPLRPVKKITLKDYIRKGGQDFYIFQTASEYNAFVRLVGKDIPLFEQNLHMIYQKDNDRKSSARVYTLRVRGLYTEREAIILIAPKNLIWAAAVNGNEVVYFTNVKEDAEKLPDVIEEWRSRFREKEVIY